MMRLAVVLSHPIQYYSPWFRWLQAHSRLQLHVFYLWDFGITLSHDPGFGHSLQWDVPLLEGYPSTFIANRAAHPGTHHPGGLDNPGLVPALLAWQPSAILLFGYTWRSHRRLLLDPRLWRVPILFRGDSHLLCPRSGWRPRLAAIVRRLLFGRFRAALAVGQANAAWLRAAGMAPHRIVLSPHAVDNDRFHAAAPAARQAAAAWRHQLGIAPTAPVVLFAGKFETKKQPLLLLEAFAALDHPHAVLVFVGAGALEADLRAGAACLPPGRVIVEGFQNQSAMPRVYALANLLVLPSLGPGETWGLCVNEAMNLGCPAIVSSHVGCGPDLVIPGITGWSFPAGDCAALAACLAEALSDPARLQRIGQAALEHIQAYSYRHTTAGLLQALALL
jgi:glycosyltransferase involved in cell wall biosynthesis